MKKVVNVTPIDDFRLIVTFGNREKRLSDIKPLFFKKVFAPLKKHEIFNNVCIEYGAITWKADGEEIDICPDKMYTDSLRIEEK